MGDQVVGQELVAGMEQARQGHPQPSGHGAVAVERQAIHVGYGRQEEVQQDGLAREVVHVLAHEATVDPGPTRCGRPPQSVGNQNAFGDHAWAPEGQPQDAQAKKAARCHAIIDDRRIGEASSYRGCPRRYIGGGGRLTQGSVLACGPVFNAPLLPAVQGAAREPLTFTIQDIANGLTTGGAAIASRVARRGYGGFVAAWPITQGEQKKISAA